jgi:hypothetical protein
MGGVGVGGVYMIVESNCNQVKNMGLVVSM